MGEPDLISWKALKEDLGCLKVRDSPVLVLKLPYCGKLSVTQTDDQQKTETLQA